MRARRRPRADRYASAVRCGQTGACPPPAAGQTGAWTPPGAEQTGAWTPLGAEQTGAWSPRAAGRRVRGRRVRPGGDVRVPGAQPSPHHAASLTPARAASARGACDLSTPDACRQSAGCRRQRRRARHAGGRDRRRRRRDPRAATGRCWGDDEAGKKLGSVAYIRRAGAACRSQGRAGRRELRRRSAFLRPSDALRVTASRRHGAASVRGAFGVAGRVRRPCGARAASVPGACACGSVRCPCGYLIDGCWSVASFVMFRPTVARGYDIESDGEMIWGGDQVR